MTQFRSREDQVSALADIFQEDAWMRFPAEQHARDEIEEAEARGAAEERRVDAEGRQPVYQVYKDDYYGWFDCTKPEWELDERDPERKRILFTHPSNIAALEARIAELEVALATAVSALEQVKDGERGGYNARNGKFVSLQMSDGERADIIHSDVTTECEGALETARAALKREGGV